MTWTYPDDLQSEDSPDLTEAEAASAIVTRNPEDILTHVRVCPVCEAPWASVKHALRVRNHRHYWRISLVCAAGHTATFLFLCEWLRGSGADNV